MDILGYKKSYNFEMFVQTITMRNLLVSANNYLASMLPDYRMMQKPGSVDFDIYQMIDGENPIKRVKENFSGGEKFIIMSLGIVGIAVLLIGLISADVLYEDASIISKHTDHDKTRVIKENGKTKELYVTIDGEEYHFVFEEKK